MGTIPYYFIALIQQIFIMKMSLSSQESEKEKNTYVYSILPSLFYPLVNISEGRNKQSFGEGSPLNLLFA